MLSVQTVYSEPVSTISSYMYIFSANCSYSYESNNYYGSNEVLQLLVFSVKCDNNNCKRKLQTFQRKNLIWVTHNFKRLHNTDNKRSLAKYTVQDNWNHKLNLCKPSFSFVCKKCPSSSQILNKSPFQSKLQLFQMKGEVWWAKWKLFYWEIYAFWTISTVSKQVGRGRAWSHFKWNTQSRR